MSDEQSTPTNDPRAEEFYKSILGILSSSDTPFLIAGTYAVKHYTGIERPTKDIDIFCKAGDYPKLLKNLSDNGFRVAIEDERWIARAYKDDLFVDIIFGTYNNTWPITDQWVENAETGNVLGFNVRITPPEELIVSKVYRMKRNKFDGADIVHIILKTGDRINWKHLMSRMDQNWELLFLHITFFRFCYPSERNIVPVWVMEELLKRMGLQLELPAPNDKVTRGTMVSDFDFRIAVTEWGYKDTTHYTFDKD